MQEEWGGTRCSVRLQRKALDRASSRRRVCLAPCCNDVPTWRKKKSKMVAMKTIHIEAGCEDHHSSLWCQFHGGVLPKWGHRRARKFASVSSLQSSKSHSSNMEGQLSKLQIRRRTTEDTLPLIDTETTTTSNIIGFQVKMGIHNNKQPDNSESKAQTRKRIRPYRLDPFTTQLNLPSIQEVEQSQSQSKPIWPGMFFLDGLQYGDSYYSQPPPMLLPFTPPPWNYYMHSPVVYSHQDTLLSLNRETQCQVPNSVSPPQFVPLLQEQLGQFPPLPNNVHVPEVLIHDSLDMAQASSNSTESEEVGAKKREQLGEAPEHSGSSIGDNFPTEIEVLKSISSSPDLNLGLSQGVEEVDHSCIKTSSKSHKNESVGMAPMPEQFGCLPAPLDDAMKEEVQPKRKKHRPKVRKHPLLDRKARKKCEPRAPKEPTKPDKILDDGPFESDVPIRELFAEQCEVLEITTEIDTNVPLFEEGWTDLELSIRVGSEIIQKELFNPTVPSHIEVTINHQLPPFLKQSSLSPFSKFPSWIFKSELEAGTIVPRSVESVPYCHDQSQVSIECNNLPSLTLGHKGWGCRLDDRVEGFTQDPIPCFSSPLIVDSCRELTLFPPHNELVLYNWPREEDPTMGSFLALSDTLPKVLVKKKSSHGRKKLAIANDGLQMVLYNDRRDLFPYMGRKLGEKKYRARVPIDEETGRVWLLLENGGVLPQETDEIQAHHWKEERERLRVRVDSFLTTMYQFQGNRRFSKWKGSVLDSVVGAFLTQNVSDHLSSSAFMCLVSKYPLAQKDEMYSAPRDELDGTGVIQIPGENQCMVIESTIATSSFDEMNANAGQNLKDISLTQLEKPFDNVFFDGSLLEVQSHQSHLYTSSRLNIYAEAKVRRKLDFTQDAGSNEGYQMVDMKTAVSEVVVDNGTCFTDSSFLENELDILGKERETPFENALIASLSDADNVHSGILTLEHGGSMDSALDLLKQVDASALLHSETGKKDYSLSKLTGIERARIEASQGGHKTGLRHSKKDWEALRRSVLGLCPNNGQRNFERVQMRGSNEQDSVNWEAALNADIAELADTIKERGMHNILAGRIKALLATIKKEHGSLDLEWVRKISMEDAKEFLGDVRGLGVKSGECIRLLTLEHRAFPVDTNVGRICVRLGWVPIEPLPEELQLHLLELYPIQESIQKYLWPRLCEFDQRTLYELHYQLITFGKVFCTKSKPNCNACPMRTECRHFASAYASAKPLLKESADVGKGQTTDMPMLPPPEVHLDKAFSITDFEPSSYRDDQICEPIVEFPPSPEPEYIDYDDIEDFYYTDTYEDGTEEFAFQGRPFACDISSSDGWGEVKSSIDGAFSPSVLHTFHTSLSKHEIPDRNPEMKSLLGLLKSQEFLTEPHNYNPVSKLDMPSLQGETKSSSTIMETKSIVSDLASQAIVPLSLESAFIPAPKLKNIQRLRTIHYVYEIPDDHFLLKEMDKREEDDPCLHLLVIWSPDEIPQSQEEIEAFCKENSSIPPMATVAGTDEHVKGTLLIPCRTATRGSFPLNGTYFQVNEVFADHASSLNPLEVPRSWLWSLRRRFVYFGSSTTTIFRGMTLEETRMCFWQGYVCVRGFDRETRSPKPLVARLHFPISKQPKATKASPSKVPS